MSVPSPHLCCNCQKACFLIYKYYDSTKNEKQYIQFPFSNLPISCPFLLFQILVNFRVCVLPLFLISSWGICCVLKNSANSAWSITSAKGMMPWRYLRIFQEQRLWMLEKSKENYFKDKLCLSQHVSEATMYWLEVSFLEIHMSIWIGIWKYS